jgi:hypothetical protein
MQNLITNYELRITNYELFNHVSPLPYEGRGAGGEGKDLSAPG